MDKRRFYDVSMTIRNGMVSWPGDGEVEVQRVKDMSRGDRLNQSRLSFSAHTGTHVDAPLHFVDGAGGVETISPEILMGPCLVLEVPGVREIDGVALAEAGVPDGTVRLLLKTDNQSLLGKEAFHKDYAHLNADGAGYLVDLGVRLVGIDYLSVAPYGHGEEVHRALLTGGVVVVEGLDLRGVPAGLYTLAALPLKIAGCDGAPARVLLFP